MLSDKPEWNNYFTEDEEEIADYYHKKDDQVSNSCLFFCVSFFVLSFLVFIFRGKEAFNVTLAVLVGSIAIHGIILYLMPRIFKESYEISQKRQKEFIRFSKDLGTYYENTLARDLPILDSLKSEYFFRRKLNLSNRVEWYKYKRILKEYPNPISNDVKIAEYIRGRLEEHQKYLGSRVDSYVDYPLSYYSSKKSDFDSQKDDTDLVVDNKGNHNKRPHRFSPSRSTSNNVSKKESVDKAQSSNEPKNLDKAKLGHIDLNKFLSPKKKNDKHEDDIFFTKSSLGLAGELYAIDILKDLCKSHGITDDRYPIHISKNFGDRYGFDLLTIDGRNEPIMVEVKTTTQGKSSAFYITRNEVEMMEQYKTQYMIVRIFDFDIEEGIGEIEIIDYKKFTTFFELKNHSFKVVRKKNPEQLDLFK